MQELKGLLNSILDQASFHVPLVGDLTQAQLREIFNRKGWPPDKEMFDARSASPNVPQESILQLSNCLRFHLEDFVDPDSDNIGHTFPAGHDPSRHLFQENGLVGEVWVSPLRDFAQSVIKGTAVLGSETVTRLLSSWLGGQSVEYKTRALLNSLRVKRPLQLVDGVRVELLPLTTDILPANLPGHIGTSAEEYLDRTMLFVDCTVTPAFFRPKSDESKPDIQVASKLNADLQGFCHALALASNSYVDIAFYWNDFQDVWVFPLSNNRSIWHASNTGLKERPYLYSLRHSPPEGVTQLVPSRAGPVLDLAPGQLSLTLCSLANDKDSDETKLATERWIASKDFEKSQVDSFIDLRIALESLYLKGIGSEKDRGEMSFRLSLYGAWHLGADIEDRKRIFETLRGAYNTASKAVHGSDFKDTPETQKLLSDAQDLCRQGILKLLKEGPPPDKNDMILGL